VRFVIVGGVAATLHGLDYTTNDLDICAELNGENLRRLLSAVRDINPRQRMHPNRPPLPADIESMSLHNLYTETDLGLLDVLGSVTGVGNFAAVLEQSRQVQLDGFNFYLLNLHSLIAAKRATGRAKDLISLPALEQLLKLQTPYDDQPPGTDKDH
jgi:predicted nucleotidyltransferase